LIAYLDQNRIRRAFNRAAACFDERDFLNHEIRQRLADRLELIAIEPKTILDLGASTGDAAAALQVRYPSAQIAGIDSALQMLRLRSQNATGTASLCADAGALPLRNASVDLVFSNLMFPFCADPMRVFAEVRRVLKHPGAMLFSSLGPDTLIELQQAWREVDDYHHVLPFMDMHDLGDAIVNAGFAEPVLDTEVLTITYRDLRRGLDDLRDAGSINASVGRNPGLTGKDAWRRMTAAYEKNRADDGRLPVTIELVYGVAWAGAGYGREPGDGDVEIPVEQILRRTRF